MHRMAIVFLLAATAALAQDRWEPPPDTAYPPSAQRAAPT